MSGWGTLHSSIRSSSLLTEPIETRWLFVFMLSQADRTGFITGSLPGLAHQANLPVETTGKALEALMAPDPESRTKEHEGRRIAKVDDGWLVLNYHKYRGNALYRQRANGNGTGNGTHSPTRRETQTDTEAESNGTVIRRETEANSYSYSDSGSSSNSGSLSEVYRKFTGSPFEDWHPVEKAEYESLSIESHRKAFEVVRGYAEFAAGKGEQDFPIACEALSREIKVTSRGAGGIRAKFVELGYIERTDKYDVRNRKAARYRWTIETTIPVPVMPEQEQESDLDEVPF